MLFLVSIICFAMLVGMAIGERVGRRRGFREGLDYCTRIEDHHSTIIINNSNSLSGGEYHANTYEKETRETYGEAFDGTDTRRW